MNNLEYLYYEAVIFILIIFSAFFSGIETALISASPIKLSSIKGNGRRRAERALKIIRRIEDALGTTLIGNNISNIAATAFITFIATKAFLMNESELLIVTSVQTVIFLLTCEIVPKIIARSRAESFLMLFSLPISILITFSKPAVRVSLLFANTLRNLFNFESSHYSQIHSKDEIDILFRIGEREGVIDKNHQDFVSEFLSFHQITANEVMVPTIDIVSIEKKKGIHQLVKLIDKTRFSRIPVYEDRVDNIIGFIFFRDLLEKKEIQSIDDILQKPYYIPETKKIFELFQEMQEKKIPLVFVVNEYGGVEGIVTPEDIAEEIVGEIQTRDHPDEELIKKLSKNRYLLSGSLDIDFFQKRFGIDIEKRGFETLAGYITYMLGRIPKKGDEASFEKYKFLIEEATAKSVEKVILVTRTHIGKRKV